MADNATTTGRDHFLSVFEKEIATTLRVLRAYPEDKLALQPHPKCKTAKDLAYMIVREQWLMERALTTGPDGSIPPAAKGSEPPDTMAGIADAAETAAKQVAQVLEGMSDERLHKETVKFFVAPKTMGDFTKMEFAWFLLRDQIHHRGQLSIYLRMADGKVPSIYGPTADESWA